MSYESIVKILDSGMKDATLTSVLVALARFENRGTGACYPTTARIALAARRSELTVRKALKTLEAEGLISSCQAPGKVRSFRLHLDALPPQDLCPPEEVDPPKDLYGEGVKNFTGTPSKTLGGGGKDLYPEKVNEKVNEKVSEKVSSAPASGSAPEPQAPASRFEKSEGVKKAPVLDSQPSAPGHVSAPVDSSLATAAEDQTLELEPAPAKSSRPKRKSAPLVPMPQELPDEWRTSALEARPDIDPVLVYRKLRCRYAGTKTKKALTTWRREYLNWIGREYVRYNRRNSSYEQERQESTRGYAEDAPRDAEGGGSRFYGLPSGPYIPLAHRRHMGDFDA